MFTFDPSSRTNISPPFGVNLRALDRKFAMTCRTLNLSPSTRGSSATSRTSVICLFSTQLVIIRSVCCTHSCMEKGAISSVNWCSSAFCINSTSLRILLTCMMDSDSTVHVTFCSSMVEAVM